MFLKCGAAYAAVRIPMKMICERKIDLENSISGVIVVK